ncbi:hypothetical protein RCC89_15655 [Cytophagaceae bacterium ABcell3]|nr:hypothetical protein RCC89_15655 [Cytophagaceae bacterium ABcell3]
MIQKFQDVTVTNENGRTIITGKTIDRSLMIFQVLALLLPALIVSLTDWFYYSVPVIVLTTAWILFNITGKYKVVIDRDHLTI